MKSISPTPPAPISDASLVAAALGGDQAAFGEIVSRYQSLVCSLAYSSCGNVARSEDIAQETFLAAWRGLASLRDPEKVKPWLCGIARKLVANAARKEYRTDARTDSWEDSSEIADEMPSPSEIAATRDEEALVWQALERIEPTYREPLILYYRQHQSVSEVASALELSEEAARQRLSRGRRLLREEVTGLIEKALERSRPGKNFTAAVLVALPAAAPALAAGAVSGGIAAAEGASVGLPVAAHSTATGASVAAAAKSTVLAGGGAALAGPALGMLGAWLGAWFSIKKARSPRERRYLIRMTWLLTALVALFSAALLGLAVGGRAIAHERPDLFAMLLGGSILVYGVVIFALGRRVERRQRQIRAEEGTDSAEAGGCETALELRRRRAARGGGIAGAVVAPVFLPVQAGDWASVGAILVAGLFAFLLCERIARRSPDHRRREFLLPFAFLGICWLALLNLRFTVWFPQLGERPEFLGWTWIWIAVLVLFILGEILLSRRRRVRQDGH